MARLRKYDQDYFPYVVDCTTDPKLESAKADCIKKESDCKAANAQAVI